MSYYLCGRQHYVKVESATASVTICKEGGSEGNRSFVPFCSVHYVTPISSAIMYVAQISCIIIIIDAHV